MSETLPGSRNYTVMQGGLAEVFPSMADPGMSEKERISLIGDSGFQGSEKRLPGTVPVNPAKRTGKKELTAAQKEWNGKISKTRYRLENTYADMKHNQILHRPFRGTAEQFNRVFNIVAGMRNFVLLFKEIAAGTGLYGSMMAGWREDRLKRPRAADAGFLPRKTTTPHRFRGILRCCEPVRPGPADCVVILQWRNIRAARGGQSPQRAKRINSIAP